MSHKFPCIVVVPIIDILAATHTTSYSIDTLHVLEPLRICQSHNGNAPNFHRSFLYTTRVGDVPTCGLLLELSLPLGKSQFEEPSRCFYLPKQHQKHTLIVTALAHPQQDGLSRASQALRASSSSMVIVLNINLFHYFLCSYVPLITTYHFLFLSF